MDDLANLDAWVRSVFEPKADAHTDEAFGGDRTGFDLSCSEPVLRRIATVFSDPCRYLDRYSDSQLGDGLPLLWYPSESDAAGAFGDASIPWAIRRLAIDSIAVLFERLLVRRCERTYAEWNSGLRGSLGSVCFMWWDMGPPSPGDTPADEAVAWVSVARRILRLDSAACQFSALHGLGHWHGCWPHLTVPIIEEFLAHNADLCPEVRSYAQKALAGEVF